MFVIVGDVVVFLLDVCFVDDVLVVFVKCFFVVVDSLLKDKIDCIVLIMMFVLFVLFVCCEVGVVLLVDQEVVFFNVVQMYLFLKFKVLLWYVLVLLVLDGGVLLLCGWVLVMWFLSGCGLFVGGDGMLLLVDVMVV